MKTSISVANYEVPMPQIVFQGELESIFATIAEMGYQGVELFLKTAEGFDPRPLQELLNRYHLEIAMLVAFTDLVRSGLSLSHPDASIRRAFLDRAPVHLRLASLLKAKVPIGFTRGRIQEGFRPEDHKGWLMESLVEYHRMARELGVTLVLEPINRYEINFINRVEEALEIVNLLRLPNLKLLLDAFHMNIEEESIPVAIWKAREHLAHFHFVDSNRRAPGLGHSPMKEMYLTLKEIGYQGFLGIEAEPKPDPMQAARCGIEFLRLLMKD
jgi:sugar phosphate isomerase/epimerase